MFRLPNTNNKYESKTAKNKNQQNAPFSAYIMLTANATEQTAGIIASKAF